VDFDDTPEEAVFRAEARAWLDAHAVPKGHPDDFSLLLFDPSADWVEFVARTRSWQRQLFDAGWAGISYPKEYGGRGGTTMQELIFAQESGRYGVHSGSFMVAHTMVGPAILAFGTQAQRDRHLEATLRGDDIWCQLFSEPGAGSDLASLSTRAVRDGDRWVVNGQKVWTSNAEDAQWGILLARTDPAASPHRGITYFLVDMASPGIEVRPLLQITGESHFSEVFLTDVSIPPDGVLGGEDGVGQGWPAAMHTLANERNMIGSASFERDTEGLWAMARARGLDADPVVRQQLARLHTDTQLLRYLGYRAQTAFSRGEAPGPEASLLKLLYGRYLRTAMGVGVTLSGPAGVADARSGSWEAYFAHRLVWSAHTSIAGGTDEVQRNIIGERVLGLPREPRPANPGAGPPAG
jgi:alkylation response protein AidB-like acyl-CoA dehydrogenase